MTKILTLALLIVSNSYLSAQEPKSIPTPEFINQIYYYDSSTNSLKPLEKTTAEYKGKTKALGLGGVEVTCEVKGSSSPVSFESSKQISFIVQLGENAADPSLWFQLYKTEVKKSKRVTVMVQENNLGASKDIGNLIKYDVKKLRDKVYQFILSKKIEKGEYLFLYSMSTYSGKPKADVFCFSVN